ncbi:MAG: insulinase family protein [Chloroflexi bacterium]|nr:insulinase family protein [Chloroflexota bacterium]
MYEKSLLPNGLRVVTASMPHTRSVCLCIYVGAGSRYESDSEAGVCHFIEHLCFKGTEKRPTAKELSEAIDGVGGILNAATFRERTSYWCKVARPHFGLALDILSDMLLHSRYDPAEMERERKVIIEELAMIRDAPDQMVGVLIDETLWPGQPLGREIAGSKESVSSLSRESLLAYQRLHYTPGNTVVAVAGDVEHGQVVEAIALAMGALEARAGASWAPARDGQVEPRLRMEYKRTEQAHLCLAVPGLSLTHPARYALDMLSVILGEGMSSRLFLELREKRGLCYDIHSYAANFQDTGCFAIYAGVEPRRAGETLGAILDELWKIKRGVPAEELKKAKELTKGRLLLSMEDSRSVAGWMAAQELMLGQIKTVDEVVAELEAVTCEQLGQIAEQLLRPERLNLAVVGPFRSERRFRSLLGLS